MCDSQGAIHRIEGGAAPACAPGQARELGHPPLFVGLLDQPVGSVWTGEAQRVPRRHRPCAMFVFVSVGHGGRPLLPQSSGQAASESAFAGVLVAAQT